MDEIFTFVIVSLLIGFFIGLLFVPVIVGGPVYSAEGLGERICNSHDATFLKVENNADRVLCVKDSRVIVFEDLRGD